MLDITVSLTTPGCPIKGHFQTAVAEAAGALEGVTHVNVYFDVLDDTQKAALQQKLGGAPPCLKARSRRSQTCSASVPVRAASASRR